MAVVGNKCDMEHQRTVKKDRTHKFAADNGFPSHDVSARTGEAVSLCIVTLAAQILGVRLTKTDQDYHKPIIIAEIGDTVDMNTVQKVVKRIPTKRHTQIPFHPHFPSSKSAVCVLQWKLSQLEMIFYNTIFFSRTVRTDFVQNRIERKNMKDVVHKIFEQIFFATFLLFLIT